MSTHNAAFAIAATVLALPFLAHPAAFERAVARNGCTQEDLPALEVILTRDAFDGKGDPRKPNIHIEIGGRDLRDLVGKDAELIPLNRNERPPSARVIRAAYTPEHGATVWLSGKLHLTAVETDKTVEGSYEFTAPDKTVWKGHFQARWVASDPRCG